MGFEEAVKVNQKIYSSFHVYPHTYSAGYRYRQGDYKGAPEAWAEAASVVKRYKYSKDDEEIYKEFMEINNELIPHILKTEENILQDATCYSHLLQFYGGLCSWEEDSATPVLHTGWVKPIVKSFMSFDFNVRNKISLSLASLGEEGAEEVRRENKTKKGERKTGARLNSLRLYSVKMGALKDLIQAEKMNASALRLQLTAQTQTDVKKHRTSLESEGRSKRARRD